MAASVIKGGIALSDYLAALLGITETVGTTAYVYTQTLGADGKPTITKIPASFLKLSPVSGGRTGVDIPGVSSQEQLDKAKAVIDKIIQSGDKKKIESNNKLIFDIISTVPKVPIDATVDEIVNKIKRSKKVQTSIQEIINKAYPDSIYQIGFGGQQPERPLDPRIPPLDPRIPPEGPEQPRDPDPREPKPRDPEEPKRDPEPEPKPPKPPRVPPIIPSKTTPTEIPIKKTEDNITDQKNPQWYSEYKFGGQDILALNQIEKLEELRNWTLFDLVNPILQGDPENLLNIQNEIQQMRRFNNVYKNPTPQKQFTGRIPSKYYNRYHFRDQMPIDYPFRESSIREQQYYDNYSDQEPRTNDYLKDLAQRGLDPDFTQIANSSRRKYTADDNKYRKGQGIASLIEGVNINKLSDAEFLIS